MRLSARTGTSNSARPPINDHDRTRNDRLKLGDDLGRNGDDRGPALGPQPKHDQRDTAAHHSLLVRHVGVEGHQGFETGRFGKRQQFSVLNALLTPVKDMLDVMWCELLPQGHGRYLVKQDLHEARDSKPAARLVASCCQRKTAKA